MSATAKSSSSQKKATTAPKRRSPITRDEGERRLIEAATTLVRERPFSEIGVRDIAALADVNHGFVHTWFGSKNDLLLAVLKAVNESLITQIRQSPPGSFAVDPFSPDVDLMVRLSLWLYLEGVDPQKVLGEFPIVAELAKRFETVDKIDPSISRLAALQSVAITIASSSFRPVLGIDQQEELASTFMLWRHILGLLAKYPPA